MTTKEKLIAAWKRAQAQELKAIVRCKRATDAQWIAAYRKKHAAALKTLRAYDRMIRAA